MASRNSMLEKILEDYPNCNSSSSSVKNESHEFNDLFSSPFLSSLPPHRSPQSFSTTAQFAASAPPPASSTAAATRMNAHHLPNTSSFFNNDPLFTGSISSGSAPPATSSQTMMNNLNLQLENHKSQNPKNNGDDFEALDELSAKGKFGWSTCQGVQFPIILRRDDKLVPVRIVESKVSIVSQSSCRKGRRSLTLRVPFADHQPVQSLLLLERVLLHKHQKFLHNRRRGKAPKRDQ